MSLPQHADLPQMGDPPDPTKHAQAQATLGTYLGEVDTVLCLVLGLGPLADDADAKATRTAGGADFVDVRVVRVRDARALTAEQLRDWSPDPAVMMVMLTSDRKLSGALRAADAGKISAITLALETALAGISP